MSADLWPIPQPIIVRPYRDGWQVFESVGVQPYYVSFEYALSYARFRASFNGNEVIVRDAEGVELRRIETGIAKRF